MKNKSHISNWAIALCAIAVFSFGGTAYGARLVPLPGPIIEPSLDERIVLPKYDGPILLPRFDVTIRPQPVPPISRTADTGDFKGIVIVD
jgi:hypothetical protein